ncbi:lactosylceramide 1,3-N-acetyl-beta-D-glucosaminyltransferase-like [Lytechinus pictus]|uniref:lactosylceramide 1,3-N-acetyl-beta-D-glucosaminyltransferase-like n=1 Tax=Lytechinus pictus TaxID=7653 RepID=UPI0030B9D980
MARVPLKGIVVMLCFISSLCACKFIFVRNAGILNQTSLELRSGAAGKRGPNNFTSVISDSQRGKNASVTPGQHATLRPKLPALGWLKNVDWVPGMAGPKLDIYDFVVNPENTCKVGNITLLILVKSAPSHFSRREVIRETYIRFVQENRMPAKVLFILGNPTAEADRDLIREESKLHGDILQVGFRDHYYNLTIKLIMGFKWTVNFCHHSDFLMSTDDDVMIDVANLVEDLKTLPESRTNFCLGWPTSTAPIRDVNNKWYCPEEMFPDDIYQVYPFGHGYVLSHDAVAKVYDASKELPPKTPFDDVYCGRLLISRGVGIVNRANTFKRIHPGIQPGDYLKCELSVDEMKKVWKSMEPVRN